MIGIGIRLVGGGIVNQLPFRFTVNTNNTSAGSSTSTQFKLPLVSSGTLNAVVDWGDGTSSTITTWNQAEVTHTYATAGVYDIKITGVLRGWQFNNGGDRLKILNIINWSGLNISVSNGFTGCTNLTASATDAPVITSTSLDSYFNNCINFNGNIGNWNVSNVTTFAFMFRSSSFNQNISSWNTSAVTNMESMFSFNYAFNQPIGSWNTSNVTNMSSMFVEALLFNQNIGAWNTSAVTTFASMFNNATAFNNGGSDDIDNWSFSTTSNITMSGMFGGSNTTISCKFNRYIGSWNTERVTNMSSIFANNTAFNQNIGSWNTSAVTNMASMFQSASSFNQNIGAWDVSKVTNFSSMFLGTNFNNGNSSNINNWTIGTTNPITMVNMFNQCSFNQNISNWNTSAVTSMQGMFSSATQFNQPIGVWNTSSVTNMANMFQQGFGGHAFNQDIGNWNVSNVTNFSSFMDGKSAANYSAANLNAIYNGWSSRPVQPNLSISFGSIKYTAEAQVGKNILDFAPNNWTIVDGGI
jgi:surface protein